MNSVYVAPPGSVAGLPESCFDGLTFRNVKFDSISQSPQWKCQNVQQRTFVHEGVVPPFHNCTNANHVGTCA